MRKRMIFVASVFSLLFALAINGADISVTTTFSDAGGKATENLNLFVLATGWTPTIPNPPGAPIANPVSKAQHFKKQIDLHVFQTVRAYRVNKKAEDARAAEIIAADAEVILK